MQKNSIVAFRRGYRLQWEAAQDSHVILYPEGMAKLNETAAAILELVDGQRDAAAIIAILNERFPEAGGVDDDVMKIGADGQLSSIDNLSRCINAGMRYSIPTLGVVAVGKDMERTDRFFKLATRIVAEMGVQLVKTYYCDNFEEVVAACPVPIVVAGGKKLPEDEALTLAYRSIQGGARGLDMGRNIFQSNHPVEMAKAIRMIVHQKATDKEAFEFYTDAIHTK